MAKKYLRKIHFSENEVWTYYISGNYDAYVSKVVIFSPSKDRFETTIGNIIQETTEYNEGLRPGLIKSYIQNRLKQT